MCHTPWFRAETGRNPDSHVLAGLACADLMGSNGYHAVFGVFEEGRIEFLSVGARQRRNHFFELIGIVP
jgi:hypothetical protein